MDPDAIREATERWVEAGLIDSETAAAIREYELEREQQRATRVEENRFVVALSLMGAVLVGAGLLTYLLANWDVLSTPVRTVVSVAIPAVGLTTGLALARERAPTVGHGCWFLGAAFLGPSVFLLADLYATGLEVEWVLVVWAAGALPAGHAFESRPTTTLGLLVALAAAFTASPSDLAPFVAAFVGVVVVAADLHLRRRSDRLAGVYRLVGLVPALGSLLLLGMQEGDYRRIDVVADPTMVVAGVAAAVAVALVAVGWRRDRVTDADALAVSAPGAAAVLPPVLVAVTPPLPSLASFLSVHAVLLGLLVALVAVGVGSRSRTLVNVVAGTFLLQVATFLFATVGDALSGAAALVATGIVLLGVGLALERGRRSVLDRMRAA